MIFIEFLTKLEFFKKQAELIKNFLNFQLIYLKIKKLNNFFKKVIKIFLENSKFFKNNFSNL